MDDDAIDEVRHPRIYSGRQSWPFPRPDWHLEEQERKEREKEALAALEHTHGDG